jgi:hypothetical protein
VLRAAVIVAGLAACAAASSGCGEGVRDGPPPAHDTLAFGETVDVDVDSDVDDTATRAEHSGAGTCRDVGAIRVCWSDRGPRRVPPALPSDVPPADAMWRCDEDPRRCTLTRRRPFVCDGSGACRQTYARLPDDADWECADVDGLVVCRDRAMPAGIVPGPREAGWLCGDSRPHVCIDLVPDRPGAGNYDCRFVHEPVIERSCRPRDAATLGGPCRGRCPDGSQCLEGTCVPSAIATPDCWTTADCAGGERCVLARCSS